MARKRSKAAVGKTRGASLIRPGGHDAIRSRAEDRLHRAPLADRIARQIRLAPAGSTMVLAVSGPWGTGKTSFVNMITEALHETGDMTVLEFNPWLFSSPQELVRRFFDELAAELMGKPEKRLQRVGEALQRYGNRLAPVRFVPVVGNAAGLITEGAKAVGDSIAGTTGDAGVSLREQHHHLAELLQDIPGRVVVVLDDVERLRSDEIREVMRLVRLTAELPNITYLLSFDRAKVEAALTESTLEGVMIQSGRGYVDKIVHELYDLPAVRASDIEELLLEGIEAAVEGREHGPFDAHRFLNLFHRCVKPLFKTVRDVRRYLSILPVAIDDCGGEVALPDVLALEAMRLLAPDSFALLPAAADALTSVDTGITGVNPSAGKPIFKALVDAGGDHTALVQAMANELFPASRRYTDGSGHGGDWLSTWRKERRVAHRDVLRFYLDRVLPAGVLPARLVELAYESLGNSADLTDIFEALSPDDLTSLLGRLEDYQDEYPQESVEVACTVLMNQHHRLGRERAGMFSIDPSMQLARVIARLLRRIDDEVERTQIIERVLANLTTLSAAYFLIDWVGHRPNVGLKLVPEDVATSWMSDLLSRVLKSEPPDLLPERDIAVLLDAASAEGEEARLRVVAILDDDELLLGMLQSALRGAYGWLMSEVVSTRTVTIPWPAVERLLSTEVLVARLSTLTSRVERGGLDRESVAVLELVEEWLARTAVDSESAEPAAADGRDDQGPDSA